jgi:drug/metabolite transporter (DMT)-like permease
MIYLIVSVLFYSLNNLLWKRILQQSNKWLVMSTRALLTTLVGSCTIIFFSPEIVSKIDIGSVFKITVASLLGAFGLICMITALQKGTLRQLGVFNLLTISLTVTYLFLFENFDFINFLLGTSLVLLGFCVYIFQLKKLDTKESNFKEIIYFSMMSLFFASSGIVHWYNFKESISPLFSVVNQELIVFLVGGIGFLAQAKSVKKQWLQSIIKSSQILLLMALLIFAAVWAGFLGLKFTNPFLASLLPLATPILTIIFGAIFFKEKWNKNIGFALLLISVGAFILHFNLNHF